MSLPCANCVRIPILVPTVSTSCHVDSLFLSHTHTFTNPQCMNPSRQAPGYVFVAEAYTNHCGRMLFTNGCRMLLKRLAQLLQSDLMHQSCRILHHRTETLRARHGGHGGRCSSFGWLWQKCDSVCFFLKRSYWCSWLKAACDRQMVHPLTCQEFFWKHLPFPKYFPTTTSQMVTCSKPSGVLS